MNSKIFQLNCIFRYWTWTVESLVQRTLDLSTWMYLSMCTRMIYNEKYIFNFENNETCELQSHEIRNQCHNVCVWTWSTLRILKFQITFSSSNILYKTTHNSHKAAKHAYRIYIYIIYIIIRVILEFWAKQKDKKTNEIRTKEKQQAKQFCRSKIRRAFILINNITITIVRLSMITIM